ADNGLPWILNFPTKHQWRYPSRLVWIEQGLRYFSEMHQQEGIASIAFPRLGCGKGGLNWEDVKPLMERYLAIDSLEVFICLDSEQVASGTERYMVDALNSSDPGYWSKPLHIRSQITAK